MANNGRIAGHAFRWFDWFKGEFIALCECGEMSRNLKKVSDWKNAGEEWHREHKDEIRKRLRDCGGGE